MAQVGLHVDVAEAVELGFAERLPMEAVEEFFVLLLHVGEEAITADGVGGGDGFVNEAGTEGSETFVDGLVIANANAGAQLGEAAEALFYTEAAAIPQAGFAFVDANKADDFIHHASDEGGADEGDGVVVDLVAIMIVEDVLFFTEHFATQAPVAAQFVFGSGDFEDEVAGFVVGVGFKQHGGMVSNDQ